MDFIEHPVTQNFGERFVISDDKKIVTFLGEELGLFEAPRNS